VKVPAFPHVHLPPTAAARAAEVSAEFLWPAEALPRYQPNFHGPRSRGHAEARHPRRGGPTETAGLERVPGVPRLTRKVCRCHLLSRHLLSSYFVLQGRTQITESARSALVLSRRKQGPSVLTGVSLEIGWHLFSLSGEKRGYCPGATRGLARNQVLPPRAQPKTRAPSAPAAFSRSGCARLRSRHAPYCPPITDIRNARVWSYALG
jgi:hypothetical protein